MNQINHCQECGFEWKQEEEKESIIDMCPVCKSASIAVVDFEPMIDLYQSHKRGA